MSIIYSRAYRQAILSQPDTTGDRMSPSATRFGRTASTLCVLMIDSSCDDQESGNKMVLANDATGLDLRSRSVDCACLRRPGQGPRTPTSDPVTFASPWKMSWRAFLLYLCKMWQYIKRLEAMTILMSSTRDAPACPARKQSWH